MGIIETLFTGSKVANPKGPGCSSSSEDSTDKVVIRGTAFLNALESTGYNICAAGTIIKLDKPKSEDCPQADGKIEHDCLARNLAEAILKSDSFKKDYENLAPVQKGAAVTLVAKQLGVISGKSVDEFRAWSTGIKCGAGFYGNYVPAKVKLPLPKVTITEVLKTAKNSPDGSCTPADESSHYALIEGYRPPVATVNVPVELGSVGVVYSGPKAVEPGDCHLDS